MDSKRENITKNADESEEKTEFLPGRVVFGKFQIIRMIGSGGMGKVFEVVDINLQKSMGLKVLLSHVRDQQAAIRFQNEARNASRVVHSAIAHIYDFGVSHDGNAYMAIELVDGSTLTDYVRSKRGLEQSEFVSVFTDLCGALNAAHNAGIAHRDLKPENILVFENDKRELRAKLLDFGISKRVDLTDEEAHRLTLTGQVIGTPLFMSPEQARGQPIDEQTDFYSLGCVMFFSLTGLAPFRGDTALDTIRMHLEENPPPLSGTKVDASVVPKLEALVHKLMSKHSADRPSKEVVQHTLDGLIPRAVEITPEASSAKKSAQFIDGVIGKKLPLVLLGVGISGSMVAIFFAITQTLGMRSIQESPIPIDEDATQVLERFSATKDFTDSANALEAKLIMLKNADLNDKTVQMEFQNRADIESLTLDGNPNLTEAGLKFFRKSKGIRAIKLNHTGIKSLDFVQYFPALKVLEVSDNPDIDDHDLEIFRKTQHPLDSLNLENTKVTIAGVRRLKDLKFGDATVRMAIYGRSDRVGLKPDDLRKLASEMNRVLDMSRYVEWYTLKYDKFRRDNDSQKAEENLAVFAQLISDKQIVARRDILFFRALAALDLRDELKATGFLEECVKLSRVITLPNAKKEKHLDRDEVSETDEDRVKAKHPARYRRALERLINIYAQNKNSQSITLEKEFAGLFDMSNPEDAQELATAEFGFAVRHLDALNGKLAESCSQKALAAFDQATGNHVKEQDKILKAQILDVLARSQISVGKSKQDVGKTKDAVANYLAAREILCGSDGLRAASGQDKSRTALQVEVQRQTTINCHIGLISGLIRLGDLESAEKYNNYLNDYVKKFKTRADFRKPLAILNKYVKKAVNHQ